MPAPADKAGQTPAPKPISTERSYSEVPGTTGVYLEKGAELPPTAILGFARSLSERLNNPLNKGNTGGQIRVYVENVKPLGPVPLPQVTPPADTSKIGPVPLPGVTAPSTNPYIVPLPQVVVGGKSEWRVRVVSTAGKLDVDAVKTAAKSSADLAKVRKNLESEKPNAVVFSVRPSATDEAAQATMNDMEKEGAKTGSKESSKEMMAEIERYLKM